MGSKKSMQLGLKAFNSIGGWSSSFHPLNGGIDFRYGYCVIPGGPITHCALSLQWQLASVV